MEEQKNFDKYLDRGMKVVGIAGFIGAAFMAINGMIFLPGKVEANTNEITKIKDWEQRTDTRLTVIEQDTKYLVKGIDEIKQTLSRNERSRANS